MRENFIEENFIEENFIEENSLGEKSIEENFVQKNSLKKKSLKKNSLKEKSIEKNSVRESTKENTEKNTEKNTKKNINSNQRMTNTKRIALGGMLVSLALILGYLESVIIPPLMVPGIKPGFANLVVLTGLYFLSAGEVFFILIARVLISGFMFGNGAALVYSLSGAVISFIVMSAAKKTRFLSITGVSILGGVSHNMAQLFCALAIVRNRHMLYYFPVLLIAGALCGALVGVVGGILCRMIRRPPV